MPGCSRRSVSTSTRPCEASPPSSPRSWSSTGTVRGPADPRPHELGTTLDTDDSSPSREDVRIPAESPVDETERLLWALMRKFERLALERYAAHTPALATLEKRRFVARLDALATDEAPLAASILAAPVEELLARARSTDAVSALIV